MANSLDMSLDDLIKTRGRSNGERGRGRAPSRGQVRGRGRGRGRGGTFSRARGAAVPPRGALRVNSQSSAYTVAKSFNRAKDLIWQHDLFEDSMRAVGLRGTETGTKLYVSNLDLGVSNEDIKELFSEVGELKRCALHYDRHGRSSGSAEIVFTKGSDALAAVKRYNNVQLDGKPMKIELIGTNLGVTVPVSARVRVTGANGRGRRTVLMTPRTSVAVGTSSFNRGSGSRSRGNFKRSGRGGGRGRGRGRGGKRPLNKSADDLDKELESYHADAMQS